jgi:phosphatidylglycerophosphatase A
MEKVAMTIRAGQFSLLFIATCGFVGYLPVAPGTYASILGCAVAYFFPFSSLSGNTLFLCGLIVCSVLCVNRLKYEGEDPPYIVIDEFAGMLVAMAGHKTTALNLLIGFILFRFFDIIKPYPIKHFERLKGGYGVVADDIVAGIFANLLLWMGYYVLNIFRSA